MSRVPNRRLFLSKFVPPALFAGFVLSVGGLLFAAGSRSALLVIVAAVAFVATIVALSAWLLHADTVARGNAPPTLDSAISWPSFEREFWRFVERTHNDPSGGR